MTGRRRRRWWTPWRREPQQWTTPTPIDDGTASTRAWHRMRGNRPPWDGPTWPLPTIQANAPAARRAPLLTLGQLARTRQGWRWLR